MYKWSGPEAYIYFSQIPTNITTPGTYTVTVTNAYGCERVLEATIPACTPIQLDDIEVVPGCGSDPGSIMVEASGGQGELQFHWSNGIMAQNLMGIPAGEYTLTITDGASCEVVETVIVENREVPTHFPEPNIVQPTCQGENDGRIVLYPASNLYNYNWSDGQEGMDLRIRENLEAELYSVTITHHDTGCEIVESFDLAPEGVQDIYPYVKRLTIRKEGGGFLVYEGEWVTTGGGCVFYQGGTGSLTQSQITAMMNGEIAWDVEVEFSEAIINPSIVFPSLPNFITPNVSGNIGSATINSSQVSQIITNSQINEIIQISGQDMSENNLVDLRTASNDLANCVNIPVLGEDCTWEPLPDPAWSDNDNSHEIEISPCGEIVITEYPAGDETKYCASSSNGSSFGLYWTPPGGGGTTLQPCIIPSTPGEYCVVRNSPSCPQMECFNYCTEGSIEASIRIEVYPSCSNGYNGTLCISLADPDQPLGFSWGGDGDGGEITTQCRENLSPGTYCVTITDYSCDWGETSIEKCIDLPVFEADGLTVEPEITPACTGEDNGAICLSPSGGYPGTYTYAWSNGATTSCIENLAGGICYSVTVTEYCGGTYVECIDVPEISSDPPQVGINTGGWSCPGENSTGGRIDLDLYGDSPPYSCVWSNGVSTFYTPEPFLENPPPGTYSVTVTDRCGSAYSFGPIVVEEPDFEYSLEYGLQSQQVFNYCPSDNNGTAEVTVTASGGIDYDIQWSTGTLNANTVYNLPPGNHAVTITENSPHFCEVVETFSIPTLSEWEVVFDVLQACNNGAEPGSVTALYLSIMDDEGNTYTTGLNNILDFTWTDNNSSNLDRGNLVPGTYYYEGKLNSGCRFSSSITIEAVSNPEIITQEIQMLPDGEISVDALDPELSSPVSFSWNTGSTSSQLLNIQEEGTYTVTVTSLTTGCASEQAYEIFDCESNSEYSPFYVNGLSVTPVSESGGNDGAIIAAVLEGSEEVHYNWTSNGQLLGSSTASITGLSEGYYCLNITDGCTTEQYCEQIIYCEDYTWELRFDIQDACDDGNTLGFVTANELRQYRPDGIPILRSFDFIENITWEDESTILNRQNLAPGTYCYEVELVNGCIFNDCIDISPVPSPIIETVSVNNPPNASIDIAASNAPAFEFLWSSGQTTEDLGEITQGEYTVSVTNPENGCVTTASYDLQFCEWTGGYEAFDVSSVAVNSLSEEGASDGSLLVNFIPGSEEDLYYHWTKVEDPNYHAYTRGITDLSEGEYCLEITDGCITLELCRKIVFCGSYYPELSFDVAPPCNLSGISEDLVWGSIAYVDGAYHERFGEVTYSWSPPETGGGAPYSQEALYPVRGVYRNYQFTITDLTGCTNVYEPYVGTGVYTDDSPESCSKLTYCRGTYIPHHSFSGAWDIEFDNEFGDPRSDPCSAEVICLATGDRYAIVGTVVFQNPTGPVEDDVASCHAEVGCVFDDIHFPTAVNTDAIVSSEECSELNDPTTFGGGPPEDPDNDGIPTLNEDGTPNDNCPTIPNTSQINDDGDNLGNACDCDSGEVTFGTDTDGDGVYDLCDTCPNHVNSFTDEDEDGIDDACDCDGDTENSPDFDGDGIPDNCDDCPSGHNSIDVDEDGVPDACDDCLAGDDDLDSDGDGVPDACDQCEGPDLDGDHDEVPDCLDVCSTGNDNVDSDGDGVPNACDYCDGSDDNVDADSDFTPDGCDLCPFTPSYNPTNDAAQTVDSDGDGVGDFCDPCPNNPDPSIIISATFPTSFPIPDFPSNGVTNVYFSNIPGVYWCDIDQNGIPDSCEGCPEGYTIFNGCCITEALVNTPQGLVAAPEINHNATTNKETGSKVSSVPDGYLKLFPNPADQDNVNFTLFVSDFFSGTIQLFDSQGQLYYHANISENPVAGEIKGNISLNNARNGLYILKAQDESGHIIVQKLVIQR